MVGWEGGNERHATYGLLPVAADRLAADIARMPTPRVSPSRAQLLLGALLALACAPSRVPVAPVVARPPAGADSVRDERLSPATRLRHLTWLPGPGRPGPWRAAVLEVALRDCVTFGAVKGAPTAVGRTTTSGLLASLPAARGAVAAVNADFFAFTPAGVPTGAHVEDGRVLAGPGDRPVFAVDSGGGLHLGRLRATGWVAHGATRAALAAWNRWPAAGLTLLDAAWGVPLDSTAASARLLTVVRLDGARGVVAAPAAGGVPGRVAVGDTLLLVAPSGAPAAAARRFLESRRVGDTLDLRRGLAPVAPREAVGGFPWLLADGRIPEALATDGAAAFRGVNPRTAIGWDPVAGRAWLVVIDGRQARWSVGTTTRETAELLAALGAREALNLDGGGSSALVVREPATGAVRVVTRPSDPTGERAVGNGLAVFDRCPTNH
jgi:hypothetical protein